MRETEHENEEIEGHHHTREVEKMREGTGVIYTANKEYKHSQKKHAQQDMKLTEHAARNSALLSLVTCSSVCLCVRMLCVSVPIKKEKRKGCCCCVQEGGASRTGEAIHCEYGVSLCES